ncbi:hypothetical protein AMD27_15515 [Acinetobacter sp. TGL-Y2]|uniref:hypothetical protein n=1 Tax=Acinetobacter sp. TGL-Y2 TaxID=1407071 RepID=UPI0007A66E2B|nr:hypothetical protein [Acinetobacter sp. TGL-Y2]AMW80167.1 hypothetical protein AMD27_15515 [Acinetobacter sp. TGL-Y2]
MAGGSRIVISDDGITISTGGKIIYKAGQHKFEGGMNVVSEEKVLPHLPTSYSLKFKYKSNLPDQKDSNNIDLSLNKELFIVSNKDNRLISKSILKSKNDDSFSNAQRFYTEDSEEVRSILCMSDNPFLFFENNLENNEEKLESLEDDNESDIAEADKE